MPLSSPSLLRPPLALPPTSNRNHHHPPPADSHHSRHLLPLLTRRRRSILLLTRPPRAGAGDMAAPSPSPPTLLEHMGRAGTPADLAVLVAHIQDACKSIAALTASPGNADLSRAKPAGGSAEAVAGGRDAPKPLDELSVRAVV